MTSTALVAGLLPFLKAIGRWIVERLVEKGTEWLLAVMEDRIDAFKRRWYRAKTSRRKRWLGRRIDRWTRARGWIKARLADTPRGIMLDGWSTCRVEAANRGIPMVSPKERAA